MTTEIILTAISSGSVGYMLAAVLGARRAQIERLDGYHLGIREGRAWARRQREAGRESNR